MAGASGSAVGRTSGEVVAGVATSVIAGASGAARAPG